MVNFANPNLKWETITSSNAGLDFTILNGRLNGIVDVYNKKTTNPLFPAVYAAPAPSGTIYTNLPGYISNKGVEVTLNATIIQNKDVTWTLGGTLEYNKNKIC